ncbi:MAG: MBL fold metallo-hydrolase [Proteobacteria bacterium]|nr:MBL fold metallo-hydrolase [Pseudomonadota bacterium]
MRKYRFGLGALASALLLALPAWGTTLAQTADIAERGLKASDFPRWKKLVPNVYVYSDVLTEAGTTLTTNSLIVVTGDGVVVVDGQDNLAQGNAMVGNIKKITPQPIKYVVIASDHPDHVGGNAAFRAANVNVVFISSPASQKVLERNPNPPSEVVADQRTLHLGESDIEILNLGRGHTGGDLAVYLPESKVLFLGELYLRFVFPAMVTAFPSEWVATIEKAQAMDVSWYVPGHGFVDDRATMKTDLEKSRNAIEYVIAEAKRLHAAGLDCASEKHCSAAQRANWGAYSKWTLFSSQASRALARVYLELDGKLPNRGGSP